MEVLLHRCMTWAPRREHYRLLRRTHHRLLLRVIGYRRERGTYRQKRSGPQEDRVPKRGSYHSTTVPATSVRGSHGQTTRRTPPEAADGRKTRRGGRSRQGTPGAELDGLSQGRLPSVRSHRRPSTVDNRLTLFGVDRAVWTFAAKMDDGAPWHKGVLQGAEKFMASWHKEEEEASRRRATKRDSRDLEPPTHL